MQLLPPDPVTHREELLDLIAKTFSHSGYFDFHARLRNGYYDHSHYSHAASRIGILDNKIVTHFGVWDYLMRVGQARLRTGGIGVVATHGDYRKRGLMDHTARASIDAMRSLGFDCTILFGIWNFYHKFGYTRAWADTNIHADIKHFPTLDTKLKVSTCIAAPNDAHAALYNKFYATATGTAVRPTFRKTFYGNKGDWSCLCWHDAKGKLAGYVYARFDASPPVILEVVGDYPTALAVIRAEAEKRKVGEVRFEILHPESTLARLLRKGTCRIETQYIASGGAMILLLNFRQALQKLLPELATRLANSPLKSFTGNLAITFHKQIATLHISKSKITLLPTNPKTPHTLKAGDALAQLFIGTDDPHLVCDHHNIKRTGAAQDLASILFPPQPILLHLADRY